MAQVKIDWQEAIEIADQLTKTKNPDQDYATCETALVNKFSIDLDTFQEIVNGIFELMDFGISPLTQQAYVGISKGNEWLAKKEVDQQFIGAIISWATEGEDIPENSNGFMRVITVNGQPEYEITIAKPKENKDKPEAAQTPEEQQVKALGFELVKSYPHDVYRTNRYRCNCLEVEFTYKGEKLHICDLSIKGFGYMPVSIDQIKTITAAIGHHKPIPEDRLT